MQNKTKFIVFIIVLVLIVGGFGVFNSLKESNKVGKLDGFAQCLASSGAKFYGTFWCPHCQNQKKMFGSSVKYVPYIECSSVDGQEQLPVCKEAGIKGYPTWTFADGSELVGEVSLKDLSDKTACVLPE